MPCNASVELPLYLCRVCLRHTCCRSGTCAVLPAHMPSDGTRAVSPALLQKILFLCTGTCILQCSVSRRRIKSSAPNPQGSHATRIQFRYSRVVAPRARMWMLQMKREYTGPRKYTQICMHSSADKVFKPRFCQHARHATKALLLCRLMFH